ncbi:MAG: glyoxalase [Pseudomonadota bacterium]
MDYQTVEADKFGASLRGIGLNLLVRDVLAEASFLKEIFGMEAFQPSDDFAIMTYGAAVFQLHADGTYHSNPLLSLVPEAGARGGGAEIRLYDTDPDAATLRAEHYGATVLQAPSDKPHGLREAYILCDNGYAWVASRPL